LPRRMLGGSGFPGGWREGTHLPYKPHNQKGRIVSAGNWPWLTKVTGRTNSEYAYDCAVIGQSLEYYHIHALSLAPIVSSGNWPYLAKVTGRLNSEYAYDARCHWPIPRTTIFPHSRALIGQCFRAQRIASCRFLHGLCTGRALRPALYAVLYHCIMYPDQCFRARRTASCMDFAPDAPCARRCLVYCTTVLYCATVMYPDQCFRAQRTPDAPSALWCTVYCTTVLYPARCFRARRTASCLDWAPDSPCARYCTVNCTTVMYPGQCLRARRTASCLDGAPDAPCARYCTVYCATVLYTGQCFRARRIAFCLDFAPDAPCARRCTVRMVTVRTIAL